MFYYFAEVNNEKIDIIREASAEEYNNIEPHIKTLSKMLSDKNRIDSVNFAYQKLIESIELLSSQPEILASRNIQFSLSGYLFEFKKFLDNWETELKRKYGEDSKEFKIFKNAQTEEYEHHMEYRIMYRLRNYDQHCGNILSKVTAYINENGNKAYEILMSRDILLENFDEWKRPEIDYLNSQPEHIEIRPFMFQLQKSILNIYEKTMQIHFGKDFLSACTKIIEVANEFDNEDDIRIIANEDEIDKEFWEQPSKTFNFVHLMVPLCKDVLSIHFRNNIAPIKVIFYGKTYKERLKSFGIETTEEIAQKISRSQFVSLAGQNMIRLIYRLEITNGHMYAVLADARFSHAETSELCTEYSRYINALCKEK